MNCQMSKTFVCISVLENQLTNTDAVDHKKKKKKKTVKSSTIDALATTTSQCLCIGRCGVLVAPMA